jgi:xanthine phosphoribosyltransferase
MYLEHGGTAVRVLKERIALEGKALPGGVIKVGSFLNHMIDTSLAQQIAHEFATRFSADGITKILTIEASGIAYAVLTGVELHVPVVYAKKAAGRNTSGDDAYQTKVHSFTRGVDAMISVGRQYFSPGDNILIIDDFLAMGEAVKGLVELVHQSGAKLCGVGIIIEKTFQPGGQWLREAGIRVESLARISSTEGGVIHFSE